MKDEASSHTHELVDLKARNLHPPPTCHVWSDAGMGSVEISGDEVPLYPEQMDLERFQRYIDHPG
eukprot:6474270-Amphidinium_carterae.1